MSKNERERGEKRERGREKRGGRERGGKERKGEKKRKKERIGLYPNVPVNTHSVTQNPVTKTCIPNVNMLTFFKSQTTT